MAGTTPAVGDLLQCRSVAYTPDQIAMNVLHYEVVATAGVPLTLAAIAVLFATRTHTQYKNLMPTSAKYRGCDFRNLMPPSTLAYADVTHDAVGNTGTDLTPTQSSLLIRNQGNFAGRKFIGHIYPGFISADFVDVDGSLLPLGFAALDALKAVLGPTFVLLGDTGQVSLALTIRHPNTLGPVIVPQWTRVLEMQSSELIATQRRRGNFGAHNVPPF